MNPEFTQIATIIVVVILLISIVSLQMRIKKIKKQRDRADNDLIVERNPLKALFYEIKNHSNHDYLAMLYARRIKEICLLGASPAAIQELLVDKWLDKPITSPKNSEEIFLKKVQQEIYMEFDNLDIAQWMKTSSMNKQEHWDLLKETILSKVRHNGFVMNLN